MIEYTDHYKKCDGLLKNAASKVLHNVDAKTWMGEDNNELNGIMEALEADGFIKRENSGSFIFHVTVKGYQFKEAGGYEDFFKEQNRKIAAEERNQTNTENLVTSNLATNDAMRKSVKTQRNIGLLTLLIAALSLTALFVSVYNSTKALYVKGFSTLDSTIQNSTKELDSIKQTQRQIDSAIRLLNVKEIPKK